MHKKIEALLKDKIGLDVNTIGMASVNGAVKRCLSESGCHDLDEYYEALQNSDSELKRLVEAVVIPETWFFRDDVPFNVLASNVSSNWKTFDDSDLKLNILSMPCSTGEEPYTIAMVLDKIGFPADRMKIDAIDISQKSLDKAKKGVYRENSFRSDDLSFRDTYFKKVSGGYRLKSEIRKRVNFRQGNLLRDDFSQLKENYDVIFCRNLLIYFDSHDQQVAFRKLYNLLAPDGVLFVGHAEANNNINQLFRSLRLRGSFAFVKKDEHDEADVDNYDARIMEFSKKHRQHVVSNVKPAVHLARNLDNKPFSDHALREQSTDEHELISKAYSLADEGRLNEAEEICKQVLSQSSNANAFYLLGVVYEASDRSGLAESMFRKAIYLMPDHVEALIHLALHVERNGSDEEARSLRRRAERAST